MLRKLFLIVCLGFYSFNLKAQKISFGVNHYFDNREFAGSLTTESGTLPQTNALVKVSFKEKYHIGTLLEKEWGHPKVLNKVHLLANVHLNKANFDAILGIFKKENLEKYPKIMLSQEDNIIRPTITGFFLQYKKKHYGVHLWGDYLWRESFKNQHFALGTSFRIEKNPFFMEYFSFYKYFNRVENNILKDNPIIGSHHLFHSVASVGIFFREKQGILANKEISLVGDKKDLEEKEIGLIAAEKDLRRGEKKIWEVETKIQGVFSYQKIHSEKEKKTPWGAIWQSRGRYHWAEVENHLYFGENQMPFYEQYGAMMYFGNPSFRNHLYHRTDFHIHFFNQKNIQIKLSYSLHFHERNMFHQQVLQMNWSM